MIEHQGWFERFLALIVGTPIGFFWFFLLAVWGGTASYITRLKKSKAPFSIMELVGEWAVSAFAGIITAFVCLELAFSFYATAALAGVAGHMGGRAIALLENAVEAWWRKRAGVLNETEHK